MMRMSDKGVAFLACLEGMVLKAYRDAVGVWTIGVGHTRAAGAPIPKPNMTITEVEALRLLRKDIERYEKDVRAALDGVEVPQHVFDAMVSFHFNTGGIRRARFVGAVKRAYRGGPDSPDQDALALAARQIMFWRKPAAILSRRRAERDLLVNGEYKNIHRMRVITDVTSTGRPNWKASTVKDPYAMLRLMSAAKSAAPEPESTASEATAPSTDEGKKCRGWRWLIVGAIIGAGMMALLCT